MGFEPSDRGRPRRHHPIRGRRGGKLWIRIFPDKPVTIKPAETRMGKRQGKSRILGRRCETGPDYV